MTDTAGKLRAVVAVIFICLIAAGGIVLWSRHSTDARIVIKDAKPQQQGWIYIGGAVNKPGIYPLLADDNIGSMLQAAGGAIATANLSQLELIVPDSNEESVSQNETGTQKIDINKDDIKALTSLPGIGEVLAQRIIDYREKYGPFHTTDELVKVSGIGPAIYTRLSELVTVGGR